MDEVFSDSEDELPLTNYLSTKLLAKVNDFVLVKLTGKKTTNHYIAIIIAIEHKEEYFVKFLKKSAVGNYFVFPVIEDTSVIPLNDIVTVLDDPTVNCREQYIFKLPNVTNIF